MNFLQSIDWLLFFLALIIILLGTVILISIDSFRLPHHLVYLIFGFFCFFLASLIDYRIFKSFDIIIYFLSLTLLVITFAFGRATRGATRWLEIGSFSFQPSELAKPLIILSLSNLALRLNLKSFKNSFLFFLIFSPLLFFVLNQPDLGNAFIYLIIFISIFYTSKGNFLLLLSSVLLAGIFSPFVWNFLREYQKLRIISFINPTLDPLGAGYSLIQAVVTVGSGRFWGRGLGIGTQSKLKFLPERATDFIFASLAEEMGFVGSLILLLSLFLLLLRILLIGLKCKDNFGKNVSFGVFFMIFAQAMVNIGMNLGLLPITGVTLPLVSAGGSSFAATMISLGFLSSILSSRKKFF